MWADQVARTPALLPLADAALRATQPQLNPEQNTMLGEYARDKLVQSGVAGALAQDAPGLLKALGGTTDVPGTNDPDTQPQPGDPALDNPLVALMTPTEREHYREVARITVLQQQATQREDLKSHTADATQSYLDTGTAKNPPMLSDMVNAFGEEEGSQRYRQMQDAAMLGQTKQRMLPLPQGELNRLRSQVPGEDDAQGQRNYKALSGAIDSIEQERRTDPLGFALKTKSCGLSPIKDFSDPAAVAAELGKRQRASTTLRADYGTEPTVLSKEENAQFTQTLKALPGDKQAALLQQFAQGLNDPQMMDTAMRGISANAPVQALAGLAIAKDYAGSEDEEMGHLPLGGSGKISAGQTMLEGEAARNPPADKPDPKPIAMPPDEQTRSSYTNLIGDRFSDQPGAEEAHYQAALAAYAGLSKQAGDSTGEFNQARWNAAVNLVVNGSGTAREIGLVASGAEEERPTAAQSHAMDTLDPDKPNPLLAKHEENPTQLAFNTTLEQFNDGFGGTPFSTAPESRSDDATPPVAESAAPTPPQKPPASPSLKLGVNAAHTNSLVEAGKLIGEPPETVAALVDVETDRLGMHEKLLQKEVQDYFFPNGSPDKKTLAAKKKTREWQDKYLEKRDTWIENGKESGGHTKAVGLTQMTPPAWTQEAETPGSYLNQIAVSKGLVDSHNKVIPEKNAELMGLRVDPKLSIIAGAQYAKHVYQHVLDKQDPANPVIPPNLSNDDRAYFLYICHHEGMTNALPFLQGTLSEKRSSVELYQNISSREASALIERAGSAQAAYKEWLINMTKTRVIPKNFRN
jgi:hypothetical protein